MRMIHSLRKSRLRARRSRKAIHARPEQGFLGGAEQARRPPTYPLTFLNSRRLALRRAAPFHISSFTSGDQGPRGRQALFRANKSHPKSGIVEIQFETGPVLITVPCQQLTMRLVSTSLRTDVPAQMALTLLRAAAHQVAGPGGAVLHLSVDRQAKALSSWPCGSSAWACRALA